MRNFVQISCLKSFAKKTPNTLNNQQYKHICYAQLEESSNPSVRFTYWSNNRLLWVIDE